MPPAQVAPGLYLGDRKDAKDRAALRRLNIQSIVNCTPPKSEDPGAGCPSFFERELRYLRVPIYDSPAEDAAGVDVMVHIREEVVSPIARLAAN